MKGQIKSAISGISAKSGASAKHKIKSEILWDPFFRFINSNIIRKLGQWDLIDYKICRLWLTNPERHNSLLLQKKICYLAIFDKVMSKRTYIRQIRGNGFDSGPIYWSWVGVSIPAFVKNGLFVIFLFCRKQIYILVDNIS